MKCISIIPLLLTAVGLQAVAFGQGKNSSPGKQGDILPVEHAGDVGFISSDTALQHAFTWAKAEALHFQGKPGDPVGPWYESALPPRDAFCMRDVSHQCIGAEILGMSAENKNMFTKFVSNISAFRNWCTYWEINKWDKPAPADYKSDREFWYNLPANFDVMYACWRLYVWTGDKDYISDPLFSYFDEKSVTQYIKEWVLSPDSLLTRPGLPNAPLPFHPRDDYERSRGLPSYEETVSNLKIGVDLVAAIYRGLLTYAAILRANDQVVAAGRYDLEAEKYRQHLETDWWDSATSCYHEYYTNDRQFGKCGGGSIMLLWFDALKDSTRTRFTIEHLTSLNLNMESQSYLPYLLYREGYWDKARAYILHLSDPSTKRRDYPEVSYGVVEGVVQGLMGVSVIPGTRTIETKYRSNGAVTSELTDLPILQTAIGILHRNNKESRMSNSGSKSFIWRAEFIGNYARAKVGKHTLRARNGKDKAGNDISYIEVKVPVGGQVNVKMM